MQDLRSRDDARMALRVAGQADEPGHIRGDHQQAGKAAVVALPGQFHHHRHRKITDEGEGVRRVDRDRGQYRQPFGFEGFFEVLDLAIGQLVAFDDEDVTLLQRVAQPVPDFELPQLQVADPGRCHGDLLRRGQALGRECLHSGADLCLQPSEAHHDEFFEVGGRNGDKAQAFEQGVLLSLGLREHALVKPKPRDFAVDEALRCIHANLFGLQQWLQIVTVGCGQRFFHVAYPSLKAAIRQPERRTPG